MKTGGLYTIRLELNELYIVHQEGLTCGEELLKVILYFESLLLKKKYLKDMANDAETNNI